MTKAAIKQHFEAMPAPDFVSLSPSQRTLVVYTPDGDGARLLDVALIIDIEITEAAA